ncbi:unnamed protein product [Absidia cylindrospora]
MVAIDKLSIVNPQGETIVGILNTKLGVDTGRQQPRIILIGHGDLGHKDGLFFGLLAQGLPYSSFRFDFRGNGESDGKPGYANMKEDADDIATVATHFENEGYEVYGIIGHSRGAIACLKYASTCRKPIPHVINCSGRYKMTDKKCPETDALLDKHGYFDWPVKQRDGITSIQVTREDVDKFTGWDNSHVKNMPLTTCVLTVHGINDKNVPVYNAAMYANAIPNHTLALLPDTDHNFTGHHQDVVKTIVDHLNKHEDDAYEKMTTMNLHSGVIVPRWIDVQGVKNFRDLGGWPIKDGSGYVRERTIFRCGHLGEITPDGIKVLQGLNVKAVFDFRSEPEAERYGSLPVELGIDLFPNAVYVTKEFDPKNLALALKNYCSGPQGMAKTYLDTLENGKQSFGNVLHHIIKEFKPDARNSMIVHCTAGKDRTGLWCMLLLGLCGVDDEVIAREYALSNLGYWLSDEEVQRHADHIKIPVEIMKLTCSAPYEAMKACLAAVKEQYGSIELYVQNECGLSADECNKLRQLMVVPIPFEQKQFYRGQMTASS